MDAYDKLLKKYGTRSKEMLPPPMSKEDVEDSSKELDIYKDLRNPKLSPFLQEHVLEEGEDGLAPEEFEFLYSRTKPFETGTPISKDNKDLLQENIADIPIFESPGGDRPTVPPPHKKSKLSSNQLIKLCDLYYKLASR